ncbi:MAG: SDR family oxidoreductase [Chloroflexi bacterium]|nr:SDR family oxidoreductase [Chloroflexota bacterium]
MPRTVVVSGGSRGLGEAIVWAFLDRTDCLVATFSRSRTPFVEETLRQCSDRFCYQELDLTDRRGIGGYVRSVRERFGGVDILVNNAGVALDGILAIQPPDEIERMVDVNLKGTVALTRACVREMLPRRWGRVITVTSIVAKTGYRGLVGYSLTKAGLEGFTRALARELGDRGITANAVAPGFLATEMTHGLTEEQKQQIVRRTPAGRLGEPADVVPLVLFLASEEAEFITGQTVVVDGGLTA